MAHEQPIKPDPGINQPLILRRKRNATVVFRFKDTEGNDYPITDNFRFVLKPMAESGEGDHLIDITNADLLVIESNEIRVPFTEENSDIDRKKCYYELINTTSGQNWFQDYVQVIQGNAPDGTVTEVEGTINIGEQVVSVTMTTSGSVAGASTASDVSFTPAGGIASDNVQAAIEELDVEKLGVGDLSESVVLNIQTTEARTFKVYADAGDPDNFVSFEIGTMNDGIGGYAPTIEIKAQGSAGAYSKFFTQGQNPIIISTDGVNTTRLRLFPTGMSLDSRLNYTSNLAPFTDRQIPDYAAVKAFANSAAAAIVDSSPAALDTLNELAAALGNDPNFATTVLNALADKASTAALALKADITSVIGLQDLYIPAEAFSPRTTSGCSALTKREIPTSLINIQTLNFDQTNQEFSQYMMVMPRNWNRGTLTAKVVWTAAGGTAAQTVQWGISAGAYGDGDLLTAALGTAITVDDAFDAVNKIHTTDATSAITVGGSPADGDLIVIQVSRNPASDNLAADAEFKGLFITLTTDSGVAV